MLYLRTLKTFLKNRPVLNAFYLVVSFVFFAAIINQGVIKEEVNRKLFPGEGRYFHMIVKGSKDYSFLKEKLEDLPGVTKVEVVDGGVLGKRTTEVIKELDLDVTKIAKKLTYTGLTVYMEKDLGSRNLSLMKEYVARIVGKDNLTTTSTIERKTKKKSNWLITTLKKIPQLYLITVLAIIWNILFFMIVSSYKQFSFIYERYQRRNGFAFWGVLLLTIAPFLIAIASSLSNGLKPYEILVSFTVLLSLAYFSTRRLKWY